MTNYSVNGKGHRILRSLERPLTFAQMADIMGLAGRSNARRKVFYLVQKMRDDGLLRHGADGIYTITRAGEDRLQALDVETTSVRLFAPRAA